MASRKNLARNCILPRAGLNGLKRASMLKGIKSIFDFNFAAAESIAYLRIPDFHYSIMSTQEPDFDAQLVELEQQVQEDISDTEEQEVPTEQPETEEVAVDEPEVEAETKEQDNPSETIVEIPMETEPEASDAPNEPAEEEEAAAEAETSEDQAADTETPEDAPAPSPVAPTKISKAPIKPLVTRKAGFAAPKKSALPPVASKPAAPSAPVKAKPLVKKLPAIKAKPTTNEPADDGEAANTTTSPAPTKPKPAAKVPIAPKKGMLMGTAKPAIAAKPKATTPAAAIADSSKPEGAEVKGTRNAYIFFQEANRARVKEENPGATMGELAKILGEAYRSLSDEEKYVFTAQAAADKERYGREVAAGGVPKQRKTKAKADGAAAVKKPTVKRAKTSAFELFCEEQHPVLKSDNPKAGAAELSKLLSDAWKELSNDDKAPFLEQSKQLKAAATAAAAAATQAADDDAEEAEPSTAAATKRKRAGAPRTTAAGKKRSKRSSDVQDDVDMTTAGDDEQEEEDDIDRENVDWESHPAEYILSKTRTKYIVARQGLPLHEYGEVSIAAANLHIRAGQDLPEGQICPLTVEHLDDYESFCKSFKRDVFDNSEGTELDLDNLQEGSKLESCSFLGAMRAPGYELNAPNKKEDIAMKVPVMATSRVVQRMLEVERSRADAERCRAEKLKAQLDALLAVSMEGKELVEEEGGKEVVMAEV